MLTLFTSPKAFRGHIEVIQNNALHSWSLLGPECEIILFGDDPGTAEAAARFGARHIPQVACNEQGTPLISAMFQAAQENARQPLVCYVNADIILMSDFPEAVRRIDLQRFLLVGQRVDIDLESPLDFDSPEWEQQLRGRLQEAGRLHPPTGIDYFVFPRHLYRDMPPFAVGRPGWDNWTIYRARAMKVPVIDATGAVTAVHQNHNYAHHPQGKAGAWHGKEAQRNRALMGGSNRIYDVRDATWKMAGGRLKRVSLLYSLRRAGFRLLSRLAMKMKGGSG